MGVKELILIVEDDGGIRESLAEYLELEGYQVATARDGQEGLARLAELSPAVVLLDLHMPVVNGEQFLTRLRADERLRDLPVILVTGSGTLPGLQRLPAQAFLSKPFDVEDLLAAVKRVGRPG